VILVRDKKTPRAQIATGQTQTRCEQEPAMSDLTVSNRWAPVRVAEGGYRRLPLTCEGSPSEQGTVLGCQGADGGAPEGTEWNFVPTLTVGGKRRVLSHVSRLRRWCVGMGCWHNMLF
jgi:hypothetical protein